MMQKSTEYWNTEEESLDNAVTDEEENEKSWFYIKY